MKEDKPKNEVDLREFKKLDGMLADVEPENVVEEEVAPQPVQEWGLRGSKAALIDYGMWYQRQGEAQKDYILPLKGVEINGVLDGFIATLDITLAYTNESSNSPIECSYEFPLDSETIFAGLTATMVEWLKSIFVGWVTRFDSRCETEA